MIDDGGLVLGLVIGLVLDIGVIGIYFWWRICRDDAEARLLTDRLGDDPEYRELVRREYREAQKRER